MGKMLSGLMSLIFCCKITILVSKCGVNKMKFRLLWCNGLETFSWHTLSPSVTIECLNNTEYLIIIADHVHLYGHLITTVYHLLLPASSIMSQNSNYLKTCILNLTVQETCSLHSSSLYSHHISVQPSTFEMWWNRRFTS